MELQLQKEKMKMVEAVRGITGQVLGHGWLAYMLGNVYELILVRMLEGNGSWHSNCRGNSVFAV